MFHLPKIEAIFFLKKEKDEKFTLKILPACFVATQIKITSRSSNELTGQEQVI